MPNHLLQSLRLQKEYEYYQKEVKENEKKLGEMKADSDKYDEYDIKRFQQVLDESFMMVPDSQKRFKNAIEDLEMFIEELKKEESSSEMAKAALEGEWYNTAQAVLQEQKKMSETEGAGFVQIQTYVDDLGDDEAF